MKLSKIISNLVSNYSTSNHDKHFVTGYLLAFFFTIAASIFFAKEKEQYDESNGGRCDRSDIIWTVFGGVFGQIQQIILILFLIHLIF